MYNITVKAKGNIQIPRESLEVLVEATQNYVEEHSQLLKQLHRYTFFKDIINRVLISLSK